MYPQSMFLAKIRTYNNFHLKIIVFTAVKYCSILHRHVCVMIIDFDINQTGSAIFYSLVCSFCLSVCLYGRPLASVHLSSLVCDLP